MVRRLFLTHSCPEGCPLTPAQKAAEPASTAAAKSTASGKAGSDGEHEEMVSVTLLSLVGLLPEASKKDVRSFFHEAQLPNA